MSNRQGIGARLTAMVGGRQLDCELYAHDTFRSQMPNQVHFGLDDSANVNRLVIRWPSGLVQEIPNLSADRHVVVPEDRDNAAAVETVVPGRPPSAGSPPVSWNR